MFFREGGSQTGSPPRTGFIEIHPGTAAERITLVGVAGASTVILEGSIGFLLICPVPGEGHTQKVKLEGGSAEDTVRPCRGAVFYYISIS